MGNNSCAYVWFVYRWLTAGGMMTSANGNIFRVTGPMWRQFAVHRWIPLTKASDAELWCFLWCEPWINGWVNNREAGDLRRHRAHYDVIVIEGMACGGPPFSGTVCVFVSAFIYLTTTFLFIDFLFRTRELTFFHWPPVLWLTFKFISLNDTWFVSLEWWRGIFY